VGEAEDKFYDDSSSQNSKVEWRHGTKNELLLFFKKKSKNSVKTLLRMHSKK
jgi:hypothetical protein